MGETRRMLQQSNQLMKERNWMKEKTFTRRIRGVRRRPSSSSFSLDFSSRTSAFCQIVINQSVNLSYYYYYRLMYVIVISDRLIIKWNRTQTWFDQLSNHVCLRPGMAAGNINAFDSPQIPLARTHVGSSNRMLIADESSFDDVSPWTRSRNPVLNARMGSSNVRCTHARHAPVHWFPGERDTIQCARRTFGAHVKHEIELGWRSFWSIPKNAFQSGHNTVCHGLGHYFIQFSIFLLFEASCLHRHTHTHKLSNCINISVSTKRVRDFAELRWQRKKCIHLFWSPAS